MNILSLVKKAGIMSTSFLISWACINSSKYININKTADNLFFNGNDYLSYTISKDENKGKQDLEKMAYIGKNEEAYAYFPKTQKWEEIGIKGKKFSTRINKKHLNDLLEKHDSSEEIIFYHQHPGNDNEVKEPSEADLAAMSNLTKELVERGYQINNIKFKIISLFGETEYSLTKKGFDKIKNLNKISEDDADKLYMENRKNAKVKYHGENRDYFTRIAENFQISYKPLN